MQDYPSDALDQYFDALLRDSNTQPPAELDTETARLVKALVETRTQEVTDERVKDRVWSRVLFATYAPPELEPTYNPITPDEPRARIIPRRQRLDVAFLAAAVFAVFCLTGLFIQYTDTARDSLSHYQLDAATTDTVDTRKLPRERFLPSQDWRRIPVLLIDTPHQKTAALPYFSVARHPE
jgi:hypothetical protein